MYCFKSDGDKPVRFQMRTYYDDAVGWSGGMVRYAKAKTALPLVVEHVDEEVLAEGRPHQFTTTWVEMVDGRINGRYEMMSQGAMIYSMTYTSARTGKQTAFGRVLDVDASGTNRVPLVMRPLIRIVLVMIALRAGCRCRAAHGL